MAALLAESFDHYLVPHIPRKWTQIRSSGLGQAAPLITSLAGIRGTYGLRLVTDSSHNSQSVGLTVSPGDNTFIAGSQFRTNTLNALATSLGTSLGEVNAIFQCLDLTTYQLRLTVRQDGKLQLMRGGNAENNAISPATIIDISDFAIQTDTFYYIWLKAVISNSGSYLVMVNGDVWMQGSADTQASANASYSQFVVGPMACQVPFAAGQAFDYDDTIFLDGTGTRNNDILCAVPRIDALFDTGAGALAQWTPNGGVNYDRVHEGSTLGGTDADDDVTYNETSGVGDVDTFTFPDLPVPGATIKFVQSNLVGRRTDAGASSVGSVFRLGDVNYATAGFGQTSTYADHRDIYDAQPDTGGDWTEAGFNAAEYGYKKTL